MTRVKSTYPHRSQVFVKNIYRFSAIPSSEDIRLSFFAVIYAQYTLKPEFAVRYAIFNYVFVNNNRRTFATEIACRGKHDPSCDLCGVNKMAVSSLGYCTALGTLIRSVNVRLGIGVLDIPLVHSDVGHPCCSGKEFLLFAFAQAVNAYIDSTFVAVNIDGNRQAVGTSDNIALLNSRWPAFEKLLQHRSFDPSTTC